MLKISILACSLLLWTTHGAMAQEFPKKQPIKIVIATNAGGVTDALARVTAEFLQRRVSQAVVVEPKPGAASVIGADYTAKSAPDGYTLYLAGPELAVIPALRNNLPYRFDEFTYLIRPFTTSPLIVAGPKSPFSSTTDLVTYMKANPGKLTYGTPGVGSFNHVGGAMFEASAGVKGLHVPYTGIAPVYQGLLAGDIDITMGAVPPFPDTLKVLGPAGTKRHPLYPNLPTLEELGYKNAGQDVWFGFLAPPNLPKPIADRLTAEISAVLKDPEAIAKFQSVAKFVPDVNPLIGDEFKKRVLEENKRWKIVAEQAKISLQ